MTLAYDLFCLLRMKIQRKYDDKSYHTVGARVSEILTENY